MGRPHKDSCASVRMCVRQRERVSDMRETFLKPEGPLPRKTD